MSFAKSEKFTEHVRNDKKNWNFLDMYLIILVNVVIFFILKKEKKIEFFLKTDAKRAFNHKIGSDPAENGPSKVLVTNQLRLSTLPSPQVK